MKSPYMSYWFLVSTRDQVGQVNSSRRHSVWETITMIRSLALKTKVNGMSVPSREIAHRPGNVGVLMI